MILHSARLRRINVDLKTDKDDLPDEKIVVTLELPHRPDIVRELAGFRGGESLSVEITKTQSSLDLDGAGGK